MALFSRKPHQSKATHSRGFTLVETLISILIISIAIATATTAIQQALQTSNYAKDQITAYYLAEDGMEYVIAQRDTGAVQAGGWMSRIQQCLTTPDTLNSNSSYGNQQQCQVDSTLGATAGNNYGITACGPTANPTGPNYSCNQSFLTVYICPSSSGGSQYEQFATGPSAGCTATPFTRSISITPIQVTSSGSNSDTNQYNEAIAKVTVTWKKTGIFGGQTYTLADDLYNWQ